MSKRSRCSVALVVSMWLGIIAAVPSSSASAAAPTPPQTVDVWAWCGVNPDLDPAAATAAVRAMAQAGGIDATFGPCNIPDPSYTPAETANRYVQPDVYMRLVKLNASVGMKTVVYDKRLWDPQARAGALVFWQPVLANIAAWDMGDEFDPHPPGNAPPTDWNTLVGRWTAMRTFVEPVTGIQPFTNILPFADALDSALADLPGSERLLSFAKYDGDKGVSLAQEFDTTPGTKLMCGVNEFEFNFVPTPASIRADMDTLKAAGCDQILDFGGFPVYDDPMQLFGEVSTVDTTGAPTDRAPATQEGSGHSTLIPIGPARLLETRTGPGLGTVDGGFSGQGIRPPDSVLALGVVGRAQLPSWARSVVLNVTVTGALGSGFLTVYPCDQPRPLSSNLNYGAGTTRAVAVIAQIDSRDGTVCIYTQTPTHVLVDLTGFYPFGASFTAVQPARLLETRVGAEFTTVDNQFVGIGRRPGNTATEVKVAGRGGVPANASSVAVSVTAINPSLVGFITVYPCGEAIPVASTLNFDAGAIVPNSAIVKVGTGGSICVLSNVETDVVVDVNGYDAANAVARLFEPTRVLETRIGPGLTTADHLFEGVALRPDDSVLQLPIGGRLGVPLAIRAAVLNITVTGSAGSGFVTVYPCGSPRPVASTLNYGAGATVANLAIATTSVDGKVCIYTQRAVHLIVDLSGYHT
jgi:hypothetical protein